MGTVLGSHFASQGSSRGSTGSHVTTASEFTKMVLRLLPPPPPLLGGCFLMNAPYRHGCTHFWVPAVEFCTVFSQINLSEVFTLSFGSLGSS